MTVKERVKKQKLSEVGQAYRRILDIKKLIKLTEKAKESFKFKDFEGSYLEFVKTSRKMFDDKILEYNEQIEGELDYIDMVQRAKGYKLEW